MEKMENKNNTFLSEGMLHKDYDRKGSFEEILRHIYRQTILCLRNAYRILVGKPETKRPLGRPRRPSIPPSVCLSVCRSIYLSMALQPLRTWAAISVS
jgi:hypothetical protein